MTQAVTAREQTTQQQSQNNMQKRLSSLITAATAGLLMIGFVAISSAADASGKYTWSMGNRGGGGGGGGTPRVQTLTLKADGAKLTGNVAMPGRNGGAARETAIEEGKVTGDDISFSITREFNGNKMVTKYSGKVSADGIKGKIESERNGQPQSRDWEAKREK